MSWKIHLGIYIAALANGGDATLLRFLSHEMGSCGGKVWTEPGPTSLPGTLDFEMSLVVPS